MHSFMMHILRNYFVTRADSANIVSRNDFCRARMKRAWDKERSSRRLKLIYRFVDSGSDRYLVKYKVHEDGKTIVPIARIFADEHEPFPT